MGGEGIKRQLRAEWGEASRNGQVRASRREKTGGGCKAPPRDLNPAFPIREEEQGQASSPPGTLERGFRSFLSLTVHIPGWGTALGGTALWMATDATWQGAWWKREVGSIIPFSPRTGPCSAQGTPWEAAPIHSCVTPKKGL